VIAWLKSRTTLIAQRDEAVYLARDAAAKYAAAQAEIADLKSSLEHARTELHRSVCNESAACIEAVKAAQQLTNARREIGRLEQKLARTSAAQPRDRSGRFVSTVMP